MYLHKYTRFVRDWRLFFQGAVADEKHHTHTQKNSEYDLKADADKDHTETWVWQINTQSCVMLNVWRVGCVYIRWDWETTLARLRPLLSTTEVLAPPTLPELCLLVRTRPGRQGEAEREAAGVLIHMNDLCVCVFTPNPGQRCWRGGKKSGEKEWRRPPPPEKHTGGKQTNLGPFEFANNSLLLF